MAEGIHEENKVSIEIRDNYVKDKAASGRRTFHCGDEVATALKGLTLNEVYRVAASFLDVDEGELRSKYQHLNIGMQRMNLGNKIRAVIRKDASRVDDLKAMVEQVVEERPVAEEVA